MNLRCFRWDLIKIYDFAPATSRLRLKKPRPLHACWSCLQPQLGSACVQSLPKSMIAKLLKACFWCHPQYDYSSHPEMWNNMRDLGPSQIYSAAECIPVLFLRGEQWAACWHIYGATGGWSSLEELWRLCAQCTEHRYKPGWISLCAWNAECRSWTNVLKGFGTSIFFWLQSGCGFCGQMHQRASEPHQQANKREPHLQTCIMVYASTLATVFRQQQRRYLQLSRAAWACPPLWTKIRCRKHPSLCTPLLLQSKHESAFLKKGRQKAGQGDTERYRRQIIDANCSAASLRRTSSIQNRCLGLVPCSTSTPDYTLRTDFDIGVLITVIKMF